MSVPKTTSNMFVSNFYNNNPGLLVTSCGHWKIKNHIVENRTREDYLIIYCIGGEGIYFEGKRKYQVKAGTIFTAFPNIAHSYRCNSDGWDICFVHFSGDFAKQLVEWTGLKTLSPAADIGLDKELIRIFKSLINTATKKKLNYEITAVGFLYQLLLQIKTSSISNHFLKSGLQYAIDSQSSNINEMAKLAGMSKYHFIRQFKSALGITPGQYVIQKKITQAKELLHDPNLTIKEIAFSVGFNDPDYFSKSFKKHTGYSPKYFRTTLD